MEDKPQFEVPLDHLQSSAGTCEERTERLFVPKLLRARTPAAQQTSEHIKLLLAARQMHKSH